MLADAKVVCRCGGDMPSEVAGRDWGTHNSNTSGCCRHAVQLGAETRGSCFSQSYNRSHTTDSLKTPLLRAQSVQTIPPVAGSISDRS